MTSCKTIALRRNDNKKNFEACKEAYRSMKPKSGVYCGDSEVKDTGKDLAKEDEQDTSMQDVDEEDTQEEQIRVKEEIHDEAMELDVPVDEQDMPDVAMEFEEKNVKEDAQEMQDEALEFEEKNVQEYAPEDEQKEKNQVEEMQDETMEFEEKNVQRAMQLERGLPKLPKVGYVMEPTDLPKLHKGSYVMKPTDLRCMIYKVDGAVPKTFEMFRLLESVRHPALVRHHTFYEDRIEKRHVPRIVLSGVDSTLWDLLTTAHASEMLFTSTKSGASLKSDLITMIIDLCSGLQHLFEAGLYPPKIGLGDLYLCKDGPTKYRLQLLILKVEKLATEIDEMNRMAELWEQVKEIIEQIRETTKTAELDQINGRFISYIGNDVSALAKYPLSWTYYQKGCYLMSIISADESVIRGKLKNSGLEWAKDETGNLPKLIQLLIDNDKKRFRPSNYNTEDPYDYLKLCRSTYKHHHALCKEVPALQDQCPLREKFLEKMEKWKPLIWCILYDAIGLIESL